MPRRQDSFLRRDPFFRSPRVQGASGAHLEWLRQLPSVLWEGENHLKVPSSPGIYFVSDPEYRLLYIGKSMRLRSRVSISHDKYQKALYTCYEDSPVLCWMGMPKDEGLLLTVESALIYQYQPPLNTSCTQDSFDAAARRKHHYNESLKHSDLTPKIIKQREREAIARYKSKPCPVCTEQASTLLQDEESYRVRCKSCGFTTKAHETEVSAYNEWVRAVEDIQFTRYW